MGILDWFKNKRIDNRSTYKKNIDNDGKLINNNKETSKSSELNEEQKIVVACYPKLKGINFSKVKFGASGNSAAEFFASDIDGDWHYAQSQMIMLFKAFSKNRIEMPRKNIGDFLMILFFHFCIFFIE